VSRRIVRRLLVWWDSWRHPERFTAPRPDPLCPDLHVVVVENCFLNVHFASGKVVQLGGRWHDVTKYDDEREAFERKFGNGPGDRIVRTEVVER